MDPLTCTELMLEFSGLNLTCKPYILTDYCRALVVSVLLTVYCMFLWYTTARVVCMLSTCLLKVCNTEPYGRHCTLPWVSSIEISYLLSLDSILMSSEVEAGEASVEAGMRFGSSIQKIVASNIELYIVKPKVGGYIVCGSLEVLPWSQEEE